MDPLKSPESSSSLRELKSPVGTDIRHAEFRTKVSAFFDIKRLESFSAYQTLTQLLKGLHDQTNTVDNLTLAFHYTITLALWSSSEIR